MLKNNINVKKFTQKCNTDIICKQIMEAYFLN